MFRSQTFNLAVAVNVGEVIPGVLAQGLHDVGVLQTIDQSLINTAPIGCAVVGLFPGIGRLGGGGKNIRIE